MHPGLLPDAPAWNETPYRPYSVIVVTVVVVLVSIVEVLFPRVVSVIVVLTGRPVVVVGETAQYSGNVLMKCRLLHTIQSSWKQ